jgi:hypothetical protein
VPTTDPGVTETPEPVVPEPEINYSHPVVILMDKYFGAIFPAPTPLPGEVVPPVVPGTGTGLTAVGEQIATYHAEGMGFGVLVKLYAMAADAQQACAGDAASTGCSVNVDSLVTQFQSGTGMGALMKQYGRPSMMGVGQVRKAVKNQDNGGSGNSNSNKGNQNHSNNGKGKGKKGK